MSGDMVALSTKLRLQLPAEKILKQNSNYSPNFYLESYYMKKDAFEEISYCDIDFYNDQDIIDLPIYFTREDEFKFRKQYPSVISVVVDEEIQIDAMLKIPQFLADLQLSSHLNSV